AHPDPAHAGRQAGAPARPPTAGGGGADHDGGDRRPGAHRRRRGGRPVGQGTESSRVASGTATSRPLPPWATLTGPSVPSAYWRTKPASVPAPVPRWAPIATTTMPGSRPAASAGLPRSTVTPSAPARRSPSTATTASV